MICKNRKVFVTVLLVFFIAGGSAFAGYMPSEILPESKECIDCHKKESPSIYEQWGQSQHFRANVGCYECHKAEADDPDALEHEGQTISIIVSPDILHAYYT